MKTITVAEFEEQCAGLIDTVDADGIIITKNGKPVAKLVPMPVGPVELIGSMEGKVEILGDIYSTGIKWDAES